jgi:UPF0042 nucleotide-binding protein
MPERRRARFVFITGLSGSGKTMAMKALEDAGFFCVDNLPAKLILPFAELTAQGGENIERVAIAADIRERGFLKDFPDAHRRLSERGFPVTLVFLEARNEILVRRFSESRRPHPLQEREGSLAEAVKAEERDLGSIRQLADRVIDTSEMTVHELRRYVMEQVVEDHPLTGPSIHVLSFGYKYGVPPGADLVFDVRFLPNPYFENELRAKDGNDPAVEKFLLAKPDTLELLERLEDFLAYLLPLYAQEGKANLTIAIGCTGGKHRSVAISEALALALSSSDVGTFVVHRDLGHE